MNIPIGDNMAVNQRVSGPSLLKANDGAAAVALIDRDEALLSSAQIQLRQRTALEKTANAILITAGPSPISLP